MNEIQQQVEQFMKDHWVFDDDYKGTALYHDTHNLLRKAVEECCDCTTMMCEETAIRSHFAWLLGIKEK